MERSKSAQPSDSGPNSAKTNQPKSTIEALNELDATIHLEEQGLDEVKVSLDDLNRMAEEDDRFVEGNTEDDSDFDANPDANQKAPESSRSLD